MSSGVRKQVCGWLIVSAAWCAAAQGAVSVAVETARAERAASTAANDAARRGDDAGAVMAHLWFVAFDRSVEANELPFDVASFAIESRGREGVDRMVRRENGRIMTTGLARQKKIAEMSVKGGGCRLAFKGQSLVTEGEDEHRKAPWRVIAAPAVMVMVGQTASITVGQKASYMVKNADGSLRVVETEEMCEGALVELKVERGSEKDVRFGQINLKMRRVASREPIEGVPFDVGVPVVDTRETNLGLTIEPDSVAMIPLPQGDEEQPITVFLTANYVKQDSGAK